MGYNIPRHIVSKYNLYPQFVEFCEAITITLQTLFSCLKHNQVELFLTHFF